MAENPISPAIKKFLDEALPADGEARTLALGETHSATGHYRYLAEHLSELKRDHRLGAIMLEGPAYWDVFLWAYKDRSRKSLPVKRNEAEQYMTTMTQLFVPPAHRRNIKMRSEFVCDAIDAGIKVFNIDARDEPLEQIYGPRSMARQSLEGIFTKHPDLRKRLRLNANVIDEVVDIFEQECPRNYALISEKNPREMISYTLGKAFVAMEARLLCAEQPIYKRWLENTEAVIAAGKSMGLEADSVNAALIATKSISHKNTLTCMGWGHILGITGEWGSQGTVAKQLEEMGYPVRRAIITAAEDVGKLKRSLKAERSDGPLYRIANSDMPVFDMPKLLFPDDDRIVDVATMPPSRDPGGILDMLHKAREAHRPHPEPTYKVSSPEHIAKMQSIIDSPEMQEKLNAIRGR